MSYNLTIACGCTVYVSCHPRTGVAHTRVVERRGVTCRIRRHEVGARIWLWELLPDDTYEARPDFVVEDRSPMASSHP
jgi:hypothetical protein